MHRMTQTLFNRENEKRVIGFRLGEKNFAADVEDIEAICWASPIIPTPDMPTVMEGELYIRHLRVPVINLRRRLGMTPLDIDEETRVLIMRTPKGPVGLLVDAMDKVFKVSPGTTELPSEEHPGYIQAIVPENNLLLPDFEKLIDWSDSPIVD